MPRHAETRKVPYSAQQMFDLVADVERYPEFLPWCYGARIRRREGNVLYADLLIGFRMLREKYTSKVELLRPNAINVEYHEGPFRHLDNHWKFTDRPEGGCVIDFYVDFEFRSRLLRTTMGFVFAEAVHLMVRAFESRARKIYGAAPAPSIARL
jgi:coenzyme Q-binding protein COQ10